MNKTNLIKKLSVAVLLGASAVTLAACSGNSLSTPYGSIGDTVYLSGDGYSITEKELYNEMRLSSSSVLVERIEKILYADELAQIEASPETYAQDVLDYANKAIFGYSDLETLQKLDETTLQAKVGSFVDSMYMIGTIIDSSAIDTVNFTDHAQAVLDYYKLNVAKKIYAKTVLETDVIDSESTYYIDKDTDIAAYFESDVRNDFDMSSINIRFVNQNEANATLRHFNLKAYRSQWYLLADPRVEVVTGYAATVLTDLGINNNGSISETDYQKYYDKYSVNPNREPVSSADVALTLDETVNLFIQIYDYIYPYRDQIDANNYPTVDSVIADLANLPFTQAYADFTNTTLRTYIYSTLGTAEGDTRFTSSPRLSGSYYYLVFKLQAHDEAISQWVDADDEYIVYDETGALTAKSQEIYDSLFDAKLTDSYVTTQATDRLNNADIVIYDQLVQLYLAQTYSAVSVASKSSKTLIAKVNGTEITVDEFYADLESKLGVSVSIDMAIRETLKASSYADTVTADDLAGYRTNIENIIKQFGQDYYASSGYPASMGRENFLMLAFRATTIDEAVQNVYVSKALEDAYLADIEAHYAGDIYQTFADYANKLQAQYFSLTTSHLLIYVDMNEDETPDDPTDFFATLTAQQVTDYQNLVTELMQVIYDEATKYASFSSGLTAIVDEFKTAGRIAPESCTTQPLDITPECKWASYKAAGLNLKFESLSAITNATNTIGSTSALDQAFYDRAVSVYDTVKAEYYNVDQAFPSQYLDTRPSDYASVLESAFGWHLILTTGGSSYTSAQFTVADDTKADDADEYYIYQHISYTDKNDAEYFLDAYSETTALSANQIHIYLNEVDSEYGIENLPSAVSTAVSAYFAPIYAKYTGTQNQLNLLYNLFESTNFQFADSANNAKVDRLVLINQNQFFSYIYDNQVFNDVYGDWWTTF